MKPSAIRNLAIARATPAINHVHNYEMEYIRHCRIGRVKAKRCAVMAAISLIKNTA